MIKEFDIRSLFPRFLLRDTNGYALAKAIEAGLKYYLEKAQEGLDTLQDVDKMPEWRLDELAWELNCLYDPDTDVDTKRGWLKDAYKNARIHGTAEGVRQYLKVYFGESSITELFNVSGGEWLFDVNVSGLRSDENEAWIRAAVARAKNVRSELRNIIYNGGECPIPIVAGANCSGIFIQDTCVIL